MEKTSIFFILMKTMEDRKTKSAETSYVASLFAKGRDKINSKIEEETYEVIEAEKENDRTHLIYEISDLFFHCLVLASLYNINFIAIIDNIKAENGKNIESKMKSLITSNEGISEKISELLSSAIGIGKNQNIVLDDIENELMRREGVSGHVEKSMRGKK